MAQSPQNEIIDYLIWSRLSSFWKRDYDPINLDALNAIYEGAFAVLDAEYTRLFEINMAKGLATCPINSQRRWLRLDLNHYNDLNNFLTFIASNNISGTANAVASGGQPSDVFNCIPLEANHPKHWHIQFPYIVPAGDPVTRSTINMFYPTELALVIVHQISYDPVTGRRVGMRLKPGIDYRILPNNTTIQLTQTTVGSEYEFNVAMNFSGADYDGLVVNVAYASGYDRLGANIVPVPIAMQNANLPIHALVARNVVDNGSGGLGNTNNATFTTVYEFYPFTGDANGPRFGAAPGTVALPASIAPLASTDSVFIFGLQAGSWGIAHRHDVATTYLNPGANPLIGGPTPAAGSTSVVDFDILLQPGVFGTLGYLGQTLEVYVNGSLLHYSEYDLTSNNQLLLKTPISWNSNEYVAIDVRSSVEYNVIQPILGDQHLHFVCLIAVATGPEAFDAFDDGGSFDDGGPFDSEHALPLVMYISDVLADITTLEIFIGGKYANLNVDYTATQNTTTGQILITFLSPITGLSIIATYRRDTRAYVYGAFNPSIFGNNIFSQNVQTLSGQLSDVQGLIASFGQSYQFNAANVGTLVQGASIAAAGGNPLLALFFDEWPEYANLPVNAPNQPYTAQVARTLESYNINLSSIPFLTDHVLNPTVRLTEGQDYDVIDGNILSSVDLLAPRGPNDTQPGVWWCPVVLLDESFLAKNFGALVGDVRASSTTYAQQLAANFSLRYDGPITQDVEWTLATFLGSPIFTQDSTIISTSPITIGNNVTVGNGSSQQVYFVPAGVTPLPVGQVVVPTQSLSQAPIFTGPLTNLVSLQGNVITIQQAIFALPGDLISFTIINPADPTVLIPFSTLIATSAINADGILPFTQIVMVAAPRFAPLTTAQMLILRQGSPPYATTDGVIKSVSPVIQYVIQTNAESFNLPLGALPEYTVGTNVYRGMPLFPSYAVIYDDSSRPNWLWQTPEQVYASFQYQALQVGWNVQRTPPVDTRVAVTALPATPGAYSRIALTPPLPAPTRGSSVSFVDSATDLTYAYQVIGAYSGGILVTPVISAIMTGAATITEPPAASVSYFQAQTPSSPIQTTLTYPQLVQSNSLQVESTAAFPAAGRVMVLLPNGGATEFEYSSTSADYFLGVTWPANFPSMTGPASYPTPGVLNPSIPTASILRLVSAYSTERINPAFVALVNLRVVKNLSTGGPAVTVTDSNADALYALMKNNSTVIETRAITYPSIVDDLVADLLPTSSSIVTIHKHVIADVYDNGVDGSGS